MKFVVDESTGAAVIEFLRTTGHDVLAVAEATPQADDSDTMARAAAEGRIVVTNDKDFGELVFRSGQAHAGVVLLRLRDESAANRVRIVQAVLDHHADQLAGCFTVAGEGGIRIRPGSKMP